LKVWGYMFLVWANKKEQRDFTTTPLKCSKKDKASHTHVVAFYI